MHSSRDSRAPLSPSSGKRLPGRWDRISRRISSPPPVRKPRFVSRCLVVVVVGLVVVPAQLGRLNFPASASPASPLTLRSPAVRLTGTPVVAPPISFSGPTEYTYGTVTDPLGHTTTYSYDADRNLLTVSDGDANVTTYVYDLDNEQTQIKRAEFSADHADHRLQPGRDRP